MGNDILGASDSILGGCDTYTWGTSRDLDSTLTDYGDGATPILVEAYGWDYVNLGETGSSTLTTLGHIYATITYNYSEDSGSNSAVTESFTLSGGNGTVQIGTASDSYSDSDSGTITISDTTTTSHDSFTLGDSHSISGVLTSSMSNSTGSNTWTDNGSDTDAMSAQGTKSTSGDNYTFTNTESSTDNFVLLNKVVVNQMNGGGTDTSSMTTSMSGNTAPGGFAFTSLSESSNQISDSGNVTYSGVVTPYLESQSGTDEVKLSVSGPPAATATLTNTESATTTGSNDGANYTEYGFAGQGSSAGTGVADLVGTSPMASAEHMGTSPNSLDTGSGLLSALGGADVHAMSFVGAEIMPAENAGGTGVSLEESFQSGSEPTNWVSHPSGIGYRRNSPGITTWTGSGSGSTSSTGTPFAGNCADDGQRDERRR